MSANLWPWLMGLGAVLLAAGGAALWLQRAPAAQRGKVATSLAPVALPWVVALVLGTLLWAASGNVLLAVLPVLLVLKGPALWREWRQKRQWRLLDEQWADCLMMVAGGLRAGMTLNAALHSVVGDLRAPISREVGLLLRDQRLGMPLERALQELSRRAPTRTTVMVTAAMVIANDTGGGLAETLERTAQTLRRQLNMESKVDALTSQGRMQAWVIGALPLLLLLVLTQMDRPAMQLLWTTPVGLVVCAVIALLEVCGVVMILRISTIDV